jgi:deoxyribodipyrimidine photo-lyase
VIEDASRRAGLARLQAFVPRAGASYAARRNEDHGIGAHRHVSGLSPYLRHRLLTEAEVVAAVRAVHNDTACGKFVQEVCWRSYWKGWLQQRPAIWHRYVAQRDAALVACDTDPVLAARLAEAERGATGIACFDAWVQELQACGYLHNHARMWFASIWIFTLRLPWVLGADLFLRHLADGDAASNTLSWRWVGGLHTPGKHYLARADNIRRHTGGRFDPAGQLDERAVPLPAEPVPAPQALAVLHKADPHAPAALLITDEDTLPETLWPTSLAAPVAIGAYDGGIRARSPREVGARAQGFAVAALDDALARASARWPGVPVTPRVHAPGVWARDCGAAQLLFVELPVGPTADRLQALIDLAELPVIPLRRDWDAAFWPHARRGFFQLRERIPMLLENPHLSLRERIQ